MDIFPELKITGAAFLFEFAVTKQAGAYELSEIELAGLQDTDAAEIAKQIEESLESDLTLSEQYRGGCFWALGKFCNPDLGGFFRRHLAVEVNRDMSVAYQIMIALENLGESIWEDYRLRGGLLDEELNREVALQYLKKQKISV